MSHSKFLEIPSYYMIPNGKGHWLSRGNLAFYYAPMDLIIVVPAGKVNNLASVPWYARSLFPVNGPSRPGSALHDYLYEIGGVLPKDVILTREQCDDVFKEANNSCSKYYWEALPKKTYDRLVDLGLDTNTKKPLVKPISSVIMYKAVRIGGSSNFTKI